MAHSINVNQTFESQIVPFQEGIINKIPNDIIGAILYFANNSESTRLVNHDWNDLTFAAVKYKIQELQRTLSLIIEKLDPETQAQSIAELADLQDAHQLKCNFVISFPDAREVFLTDKGLLIGILRKLPQDERDQLQNTIGEELPDSLKDVFEISMLDIVTVNAYTLDLDTFFTLLQSCQPLSIDDRGNVAVYLQNIEFFKLLLADGPIPSMCRGMAILRAVRNNNLELVKLLLANGLILDRHRGLAVQRAVSDNNLELVEVLLANGPIPHDIRREAIWEATVNMNLELVQALTDKWIIVEVGVASALIGGLALFGYKVYGWESAIAKSQARLEASIARLAESQARLEASIARLAESRARLAARR